MKPLLAFCAVAAASLFTSSPAAALTFDVYGQNYPTDISAEVTLTWDGTDTLTVEIENTANIALGTAVITGFVFNVPDAITGLTGFTASGTLDDAAWVELFPPPSGDPGNAPGGYLFEGGAGTGNNIAGGSPNDGFGIGTTATFTFTFSGTNLNLLTESDFLGEFVGGASGPADFGVRFQAIPTGAGSDFALHQVPAPGAALLLALGLPAVLRRRR